MLIYEIHFGTRIPEMARVSKRYKSRAPAITTPRCSPKKKRQSVKRKQWSNESMEAALKAVKDGMGVNRAAELHGVPKTTLKDRVSGRIAHGSKSGPKSYLTSREERQLSDYLLEVSEAGYGKTRKQVKAIVEGIAKEKGAMKTDKKVSDGWWRRFLERQPQLSLRKGDSTAAVRQCGNSEELLQLAEESIGRKRPD